MDGDRIPWNFFARNGLMFAQEELKRARNENELELCDSLTKKH